MARCHAFPALGARDMHLRRILIGSLDSLCMYVVIGRVIILFLVLRHLIETAPNTAISLGIVVHFLRTEYDCSMLMVYCARFECV